MRALRPGISTPVQQKKHETPEGNPGVRARIRDTGSGALGG